MTACVIGSRHSDETPEADVGLLCFDCFGRLRSSLLELPAIAGWLHVNLAAGGVGGEKVGGTREDPIPLRQDVLDLIGPDSRHYVAGETQPVFLLWEDGVVIGVYDSWPDGPWRDAMLTAGVPGHVVAMIRTPFTREEWNDLAAEDKSAMDSAHSRWQIRPVARGGLDQRGADSMTATLFAYARIVEAEGDFDDWPTGVDVAAFGGFLAGHLSWIAAQPWVDELFDEVRKMATEAHRVAPWRAETKRDPEPCVCGVRAVWWHIAEGLTRCERGMGGCGRTQKVTEHQMNASLPETRRAAG